MYNSYKISRAGGAIRFFLSKNEKDIDKEL